MTRDQIIAKWETLSSRERNAWVAEVVFGWDAKRIADAEFAYEIGICGVETIPRYTEDITAAWTVFENHPYIEVARLPGKVPVYGARINDNNGMVCAMTQRQTAPEAIGLAAIIASLQSDGSATKLSPAV